MSTTGAMNISTSEQLETLPPIPLVVQDILDVLNRRDVTASDVSMALSVEPGLSGRLVAASNAAFLSGQRPVYNIEEAVLRLGLNRVRTVALAVLLGGRLNPRDCPAFNSKHYWLVAMRTADCTSKLAKLAPLGNAADVAYLCGLLHNIGLLVNAYAFPRQMQQVLEAKLDAPEFPLSELERTFLGFDHRSSGCELLHRWGMPAAVVDAVAHYRELDYRGENEHLVWLTGYAAAWARTSFRVRPQRSLGLDERKLEQIGESCQREREQLETLAFMLYPTA